MQKAYIVLAHQLPEQLGRLVGSLDDGQSDFFIHLDRSCDQRLFRRELVGRSRWQFIESENGGWGQVGIVKATLRGLKKLANSGQQFDIVNLISGQDYPLRSNAYFDRFFKANRGKIFMEYFPMPAEIWANGPDRIGAYHFGDRRRRSRQRLSRWITRVCNASVIFKRRFPSGLRPFGGWQWWSIPMEAVNEILGFVKRRPDYLRYHRLSLLPDEMFFQTILLNSDADRIRWNLVNNCLRFVDWDNPNPKTPATLTEKYFEKLTVSRSLFARKFDISRDAIILDRLDEHRLREEKMLRESRAAGEVEIDLSRGPDSPKSSASPGTKKDLFEPF